MRGTIIEETIDGVPCGWAPCGTGYVRELWAESVAAALEVNAALAGAASPRVERALATWTVCLWLCSAPVDEPRLLGMRMAAGEMEIDVEHVGARLLAASFRESLERLGAENYIELRLTSRTDPPLPMLVTIQRLDGKTPHELRREAEAQRDAAREALDRALDIATDIDRIARRVEAVQAAARVSEPPARSHTERRLAALRAEKKARLRLEHGVELCEACSTILRDDAPRVTCDDCTLCPGCAAELEDAPASADGGAR